MFDAGSVVAKLILDTSAFNASLNKSRQNVAGMGESIQKLGQDIMSTTKQLSRVASAMTFLGAGITAPLVLAFKSAEKYSNAIRVELERFNNILIGMRVSIAESLLPVMHRFSNILADLGNRWNALSPALRENILRTILMTGVFLTLGGTIATIVLKIGTLIGAIIKYSGMLIAFLGTVNPYFLAIGVAIAVILALMVKMGGAVPVLNGIETAALMVAIGYEKIVLAMSRMLECSARFWGQNNLADWWKGQADAAQRFISSMEKGLVKIATTGKGSLAELGDSINDIKNLFNDLGNVEINPKKWLEATKTFAQGWSDAIDLAVRDLTDWGTMAGNVVTQMVSGMQSSLSNFFQRFLKGEVRSAKELFTEFGNYVIKILSDVVAQVITAQLVTGLSNLFNFNVLGLGNYSMGGQTISDSAHIGGLQGSYLGFQSGVEKVPYTGLFKLHEGEKVTPKPYSDKSETLELTTYNLITNEAVAAAMSSKEGAGVIVNTINMNSLRNGVIRREVKNR